MRYEVGKRVKLGTLLGGFYRKFLQAQSGKWATDACFAVGEREASTQRTQHRYAVNSNQVNK